MALLPYAIYAIIAIYYSIYGFISIMSNYTSSIMIIVKYITLLWFEEQIGNIILHDIQIP